MNDKNYIPFDPNRIPFETFHPGEFIKDEIEARKLNKNDFAKQLLLSLLNSINYYLVIVILLLNLLLN